jgi:hypothetical protein
VLTALLPPEAFILRGFTVVRAVDVTESEVTSALERDLIDQESIFSTDGFTRLQSRLRTLFGQPELKAPGSHPGEQGADPERRTHLRCQLPVHQFQSYSAERT